VWPAAGAVIANLATTDPDTAAGHTYSLAAGSSANFAVSAAGVVTRTTAAMATAQTYTVNVTSNDNAGGVRTETFNIRTGDNGANDLSAFATVNDDIVYGDDGGDTVTGGSGNDTLFGMDESDTLDGGAGNDVLNGGAGDSDTASYASATAGVTVSLAIAGQQNTIGAGLDTLVSIENLTGSGFADVLTGDANPNILNGGAGADTMIGGAGENIYVVDNAGDVVIEAVAGFLATVQTSLNTYSLANGPQNNGNGTLLDNLTFTGTGNFVGTGNIQINTITGGAGNDTLSGGDAGDTLNGLAGTDILNGDAGADTLNGGVGADTLNGGAGGDILVGGDGADVINTGAADDNVLDVIRFSATGNFGDTVTNFDANGTVDRVDFLGALNTAYDDGLADDNFLFANGNGVAGAVTALVGQADANFEALILTGANGEGVTTANLGSAAAVSAAINAEFALTAANGEDALLVINDTDGSSFSLWQWIQAGDGETAAAELTLIGTFTANTTVTTTSFDFG
jgi:Ca2+-binding RTX toxin-like protein